MGHSSSTTTNVKTGTVMKNVNGDNKLVNNHYVPSMDVTNGAQTTLGYNFVLMNLDNGIINT